MDHLSRIGVFIAVVKEGGFAGAARRLGITSSAVSKQIQNLEHELKVKLLNRTTRSVSVTEEGAIFFERSSRALEDLKEAEEHINEMKLTPRGPLKVSVPLSFGLKHLAGPIAEFARAYPDVELDVHFDDRVIDIVQEGFDLCVRIGALSDSSMISRKLGDCPFYLCASPGYLKQHGTPKKPQDLASHNVLAYTRNRGAHEWRYKDPSGAVGQVSLKSNFKCDAGEMMLEAARRDLGLILLPYFYVQDVLETGELVSVLNTYKTWPERSITAIFQPNRYLSTRLRLFVDHLSITCEALLKTSPVKKK